LIAFRRHFVIGPLGVTGLVGGRPPCCRSVPFAAREADLLPVRCFNVVSRWPRRTLSPQIEWTNCHIQQRVAIRSRQGDRRNTP
jgi:hypothetical protein